MQQGNEKKEIKKKLGKDYVVEGVQQYPAVTWKNLSNNEFQI